MERNDQDSRETPADLTDGALDLLWADPPKCRRRWLEPSPPSQVYGCLITLVGMVAGPLIGVAVFGRVPQRASIDSPGESGEQLLGPLMFGGLVGGYCGSILGRLIGRSIERTKSESRSS